MNIRASLIVSAVLAWFAKLIEVAGMQKRIPVKVLARPRYKTRYRTY